MIIFRFSFTLYGVFLEVYYKCYHFLRPFSEMLVLMLRVFFRVSPSWTWNESTYSKLGRYLPQFSGQIVTELTGDGNPKLVSVSIQN